MTQPSVMNIDTDEPIVVDAPHETTPTEITDEIAETRKVEAPAEIEEEIPEEDDTDKTIDDLPLPGDEVAEEEGETQKKKVPKWVETRLSRKDRIIAQKDAEAAAIKAELDQLKQMSGTATPQHAVVESIIGGPPARENFASDSDFVNACFDYRTKQNETYKQIDDYAKKNTDFRKMQSTKYERGYEKYDDFEAKIAPLHAPSMPANPEMYEAIIESEHAEDMLYFLGSHADKAKEIALLSPVKAVKKIAEIEMRFKNRGKKEVTKAPKPITPVKSSEGGNVPANYTNLDQVAKSGSQKEFENMYKKMVQKADVW